MALLPQVVDAVSIPVVGAGGAADGRGMAAMLALGAEGVQCGTVFLTADECVVHEKYKEMILKASDISTVVTGRPSGHPVRSLKSPISRECLALEKAGDDRSLEELEAITAGALRRAVQDGDWQKGTFMAGQVSGMVNSRRPCREIVQGMAAEAETLLTALAARFGKGV